MLLQSSLSHAVCCSVVKASDASASRSRLRAHRSRSKVPIRCASAVKDLLEEPVIQASTLISELTVSSLISDSLHSRQRLCQLQTSKSFSQFDRVSVLSEALPYLQQFRNKTVVIKYGGAAMKDPKLKAMNTEWLSGCPTC